MFYLSDILFTKNYFVIGKRQRKPTAKIAENPELIQQLKIKSEELVLSDPLPTVDEALEDIEIQPPVAKKTKVEPKDEAKKAKEKVVEDKIENKTKEKENLKPGQRVKKQRANIPCPRCGKMHRNEDHLGTLLYSTFRKSIKHCLFYDKISIQINLQKM